MSAIGENIARIRAEIDAAARETGRTGKDITLVGASKMNDAAACQEAIAAGIDALGENRVQEMTEKLKENAYDGAPLHFIGHLQRNKVKQVVGKAALIQSVGSKELLDEIEKVAARMELVQDVLLEVNIGGEEAKSGFAPEELLWELLHCTPGSATILGLMNDTDHQVRLLIEREVYEAEYLSCHPCICTSSLKLKTADVLEKFLPYTGHDVTVVDL